MTPESSTPPLPDAEMADDPRVPGAVSRDYILMVIDRSLSLQSDPLVSSSLRERYAVGADILLMLLESSDFLETGVETQIGGPGNIHDMLARAEFVRARERRES